MDFDVDQELESNTEYHRVVAALSPSEKQRFFGTAFDLQHRLSTKRAYRRALAKLSPAAKLRLLEELRKRSQQQRGSRRSAKLPVAVDGFRGVQPRPTPNKQKKRSTRAVLDAQRFGGRATAGGVNYEVRVAAFIAAKMLCGGSCSVWDGISGADIGAVTLQAPEPVDDIVVDLLSGVDARAFISAKKRSASIALTKKNPTFTGTIAAFVRQFIKLSPTARMSSRLIWAIPSAASRGATHGLASVLDTHRNEAGDDSISAFLSRREVGEKKALKSFLSAATSWWRKETKKQPTDQELRSFLRAVHVEVYDFGVGNHHERKAEEDIRNHVVADTAQAHQAWQKLESFFAEANQRGIRITPASLRQVLIAGGVRLKSPPDYARDIARLQDWTTRNLARLKEHTMLRFGAKPGDAVHIDRAKELSALLAGLKSGNLLIVGEPGCGKSGLIHRVVEKLQSDDLPVVLLLAEEVFGRDWKGSANVPGIEHALDEVLANWPSGERGFLITDALDAVRDFETNKALRRLLRDVQEGQSGWTVVASVREFDLKSGQQLREAFPGIGVEGHASSDFANVSHFYLRGLSEKELDDLAACRGEIRPFIDSARKSPKSGRIHHSPFYLRLGAELLRDGVAPTRLADWVSPAVLLRKFWDARIREEPGAAEREAALKGICRQMVDTRRMTVSLKELSLGTAERCAVDELRRRGILNTPSLPYGTRVGDDEIRFTHHLLHDYAIARSLIPETPVPFCDFAIRQPLLPIFYRQSFMFALEELWDASDGRQSFWECALKLESVPKLHGITRILAPILAARRVESLTDLQPLLTAVFAAPEADSPPQKALRHLASGLQDADADAIRAGATAWSAFAEKLASLLPASASIEGPLVHVLARLNAVGAAKDPVERLALNAAARGLLAHHISKEVSRGWRYAALVAIETICRTFSVARDESERASLTLLTPERLKAFPHDDLFDLANNLKHLHGEGEAVVLRLFEAAFSTEPKPGQWEQFGTAILPMSVQSSDQWNSIHYSLAEYYESQNGENAALMTEIACIAWNAVSRRHEEGRSREEQVLATVEFRGTQCPIVEDYGHIWGRGFEHEENRILSHFEKLLHEWAAAGDVSRLNAALDAFARRNRTSLMWTVFMDAGAEQPATLGTKLESVLAEPVFLYHPDYAYSSTALIGALHKLEDPARRQRLEKLVLDLPSVIRSRRPDSWQDGQPSSWVQHAQDRLLGALDEQNIVLTELRTLWRERQAANALGINVRPPRPEVISHTFSDEELLERRGISLQDAANKDLFRLREELKAFQGRDNNPVNVREIQRHWPLIAQCERALQRYAKAQPKMAEELWGHLVAACESIVRHAKWPRTSQRWRTVRRILLKAANDPVPQPDDDTDKDEDRLPTWGWPSPRLDAARALPVLALRIGNVDELVAAALRRFCVDKSYPLRLNFAERLAALAQPSPELMWELIDRMINEEKRFSVLEAVLFSLDRLWTNAPKKVKQRLQIITQRAMESAPDKSHVYETLAHIHLFHFLRTGDTECEAFIDGLIAECDSQRGIGALLPQLHTCRAGGWLTAGDAVNFDAQADAVRARTWSFFSKLLTAAQVKLQQHRDALRQLYERGQQDSEPFKQIKEKNERTARLVDAIGMQLYFASGAFDEKRNKDEERLTPVQLRRFWREAAPLLTALASEPHPHTTYQLIQTLDHLLLCAPSEIFLLATEAIRNSSAVAGFQHESLAVGEVVKLIQHALADHRDIFQAEAGRESACLDALLAALDVFVEAGWAEARQLTHRLEEIYR